MKYAITDNLTSKVENIIEADKVLIFKDKTVLLSDTANIGDSYDGVNFIKPVIAPYVPTVKDEINLLEVQQTPRRIREAALGIDNGWLLDLDNQIKTKRALLV